MDTPSCLVILRCRCLVDFLMALRGRTLRIRCVNHVHLVAFNHVITMGFSMTCISKNSIPNPGEMSKWEKVSWFFELFCFFAWKLGRLWYEAIIIISCKDTKILVDQPQWTVTRAFFYCSSTFQKVTNPSASWVQMLSQVLSAAKSLQAGSSLKCGKWLMCHLLKPTF